MLKFEDDYGFGEAHPALDELAAKFVNDVFKAPETQAQARDYLERRGLA